MGDRRRAAAWGAIALGAMFCAALASAVAAEDAEPVAAEADAEKARDVARLAEEFSDPLTTLPQVFLRNAWTPSVYGVDQSTNRVIARVIVPRLPRYSLFPFVQLVRPSFSLVTVPDPRGGTRTEFGDMQLLDLAVLPWPGRETGVLLGVGPTFVFPTATHPAAGQQAWQIGPAFAAIYKGLPGWLFGCLIQDPISFAYTTPDRPKVGLLTVQPVLFRHLWRGLYVKSGDSTWAFDWRDGSAITMPLSVGIGWSVVRPGLLPINFFVSGEWMAYRRNAPIAPQTTVNFGVTMAFPQWRPW